MAVASPTVETRQQPAKRSLMTRARRREIAGYLLISPWIIGFVVFILGPMVASIYLSLTTYNLLSSPTYVGGEQYRIMFSSDPLFWGSVQRTIIWAVALVVIGLTGSLICAMLLNAGLKGASLFRAAFFFALADADCSGGDSLGLDPTADIRPAECAA